MFTSLSHQRDHETDIDIQKRGCAKKLTQPLDAYLEPTLTQIYA